MIIITAKKGDRRFTSVVAPERVDYEITRLEAAGYIIINVESELYNV